MTIEITSYKMDERNISEKYFDYFIATFGGYSSPIAWTKENYLLAIVYGGMYDRVVVNFVSWLIDNGLLPKLFYSDFSGINLSGFDLSLAHFELFNFCGANFSYCSLCGASFVKADLRGVDFTKAHLNRANFLGAVYNDKTIFPVGFEPSKEGMVYSELP